MGRGDLVTRRIQWRTGKWVQDFLLKSRPPYRAEGAGLIAALFTNASRSTRLSWCHTAAVQQPTRPQAFALHCMRQSGGNVIYQLSSCNAPQKQRQRGPTA